jgi:hypothetical protein
MVGQVLWSVAHLAMVGSSFTLLTMALLVSHHVFAAWHGDRRLEAAHGEKFEVVKARTSVINKERKGREREREREQKKGVKGRHIRRGTFSGNVGCIRARTDSRSTTPTRS